MGHVEIHRFAKAGSYQVPTAHGTPAIVEAKRGDFFLRPLRRIGNQLGLVVTDPPTVIPRQAYPDRIAEAVRALLTVSQRPAVETERYREPKWSLERHGALIDSRGDGSLQLRGLNGRGSGNFVGNETLIEVAAEASATELARQILEAMGERPEEIGAILGGARGRRTRS